jgi:hypothetical protein
MFWKKMKKPLKMTPAALVLLANLYYLLQASFCNKSLTSS